MHLQFREISSVSFFGVDPVTTQKKSSDFHLVMSLLAMSLGERFCTSGKGGTGGGATISRLRDLIRGVVEG